MSLFSDYIYRARFRARTTLPRSRIERLTWHLIDRKAYLSISINITTLGRETERGWPACLNAPYIIVSRAAGARVVVRASLECRARD